MFVFGLSGFQSKNRLVEKSANWHAIHCSKQRYMTAVHV